MLRHHTHLCLVSSQATPNLLPILDEEWRPAKVVLAVSTAMKPAAEALTAVLKTKCPGLLVQALALPNAYDYGTLTESFLNCLAAHEGEDIALNVTGGTKLMAVAAQEVFRSAGKAVFYVNVENDQILTIGESRPSQPLRAKLKVHELLTAHGHPAVAATPFQTPRHLRDFSARLADHVESGGRNLGVVNALAHEARRRGHLRVELTEQQFDSKSLGDLLALFSDAKLLSVKGKVLEFADEAARSFANGGWLEAHVFEVLQSLRSEVDGLSDVVMGLHVGFDGLPPRAGASGKEKNEIDVAFLYRNTLHLIECKTANLGSGVGVDAGAAVSGGDDKATAALYKMESLLKLGGLRTRGMVVDYRGELSRSLANRQRAADAGIAIVAGRQIKDLKGTIRRHWFDKGG